MKYIRFILEILKLTKSYFLIFIILVLSILQFFLGVVITYAEKILSENPLNEIIKYGILLLSLCIAIYFIEYFFNKEVYLKEQQINKNTSEKILESSVAKEYRELEKYGVENILTLLISDTTVVSSAFITDFLKIVAGVSLFLSATIFGFYCSVELTIFSLVLCPISLIIPKYIGQKLEQAWQKRQEHQEDMQTLLLQIFNNKYIAKVYKSEKFLLKLLEKRYRKFADSQFMSSKLQHKVVTLNIFFGLIFDIVLMCFSFYLIAKNRLNVAEFLAFSVLLKNLTWVFYQFVGHFVSLKNSKVSYERIKNFIIENIESREVVNTEMILKYENISYSYDEDNRVINKLNFSLENNDKVVIYGESGSGKTTLLKLLLGLYNTQTAATSKNDKLVEKGKFSYVPQKIELFNLSLKENILLGREVTEDNFEKILSITGVKDIMKKNNISLTETIKSSDFSAGEIQKIGLARALVENTILILDEPFANLDEQSEINIIEILEKLSVPIIIVSHRLENLKNFKFYKLEQGQLRSV